MMKVFQKTDQTMTDLSSKTAFVVDHGLFLPLAHRLAKDFGRVLYHTPCDEAFPCLAKCIIGDGFSDIQRLSDIWAEKDCIDVFVFPDIHHSGLQLELESQGYPVWGSRMGDILEISRQKFHRELERCRLEVPPHVVIKGISELRDHLRDKEDKVLKISKFRGDYETGRWRNWQLDEGLLDSLAVRFGPAKDEIPFLVCDNIDTDIELGCDTFCIDGQWPETMIEGYECKDEGFISIVKPRSKMPPCVQEVLEAFGPVLKYYRYRNSFSMELRVKDDKAYFIDPCCRFPMPPTGSKCELWGNISEVIWAGSHGELVEPEPAYKCSMECALTMQMDKSDWGCVEVPSDLKQWMKLSNCCEIDGKVCFPPLEFRENRIGWLVGVGDTLDEALESIQAHAKDLPAGVNCDTLCLSELIKEVHTAEEEGIVKEDLAVPEPETVIQDA